MKDDTNNVVTPTTETGGESQTQVTPVIETTGDNTSASVEPKVVTKEDDNKVDYVKIRVDRAKEQTQKKVLEELGVEDLDKAKKLVQDGKTALEEVQKLKAELEAKELEALTMQKRTALTKILDNEKVFDSEALVNYLDLEKVEMVNGQIQDVENIISSLKKAKPNFFGKFELTGDTYIKGNQAPKKTALDKQKEGNTVGAINDYLKSILK